MAQRGGHVRNILRQDCNSPGQSVSQSVSQSVCNSLMNDLLTFFNAVETIPFLCTRN